ncbi:MAG: hypothetical protein WCO45_10350 [Pseudanabaena sp. ELA607]
MAKSEASHPNDKKSAAPQPAAKSSANHNVKNIFAGDHADAWWRNHLLLVLIIIIFLVVVITDLYQKPVVIDPPSVNGRLLARVLISEASIGNNMERQAVGLTVINRMKHQKTPNVKDVITRYGFAQYATNQDPTGYPEYFLLAQNLLSGQIKDFTKGATHFFSPYSMPKKGQSKKNFDCDGGYMRYRNPKTRRVEMICTPSWSKTFRYVNLQKVGVRPYFFEFYAQI